MQAEDSMSDLVIWHQLRRCSPGERFAGAEPVSGE